MAEPHFNQHEQKVGNQFNADNIHVHLPPGTNPQAAETRTEAVSAKGKLSRNAPQQNPFFTGRRDTLNALHNALQTGDATLVPTAQALSGLGGIGKTQTAAAYAHEYRNDYNGIYWVTANSVEDLNAGLAGLAPELAPPVPVHIEQAATVQAVKDWFAAHNDWLLILDNADDLKSLALPFPMHPTGRLLLTTRAHATGKIATRIELAKFGETDGATLLLRRAKRIERHETLEAAKPDDQAAVLALSREVDGLPLALNQAGAYIEETDCSPQDYLRLYREYGLKLSDKYADDDHKSVSITFQMAIEQVAKISKVGEAAVELILICAFLASASIPDELFTTGRLQLPDFAGPLTEADYIDVRAAALKYSLMSYDTENHSLTIHRLVQEVAQGDMNAEQIREWVEGTVYLVNNATPPVEFNTWSLCERLLPHWRICAEYVAEYEIETKAAGRLLHDAGLYFANRAQYSEAETFYKQALAIYEKVCVADDLNMATGWSNLAVLYTQLARYTEAEKLHQRALVIKEKVLGPYHRDTAISLNGLASVYNRQGRYQDAERLRLRQVAILEKTVGPNHLDTARSLNNLGGDYVSQGRDDEAEPLGKRALAIREKQLASDHPDIATSLSNLATIYQRRGDYKEALTLESRALVIHEKHLGFYHPTTANSFAGMAVNYWGLGRHKEAEAYWRQAWTSYEVAFDKHHPAVQKFLQQYSTFLEDTGRKDEAAVLRAEAETENNSRTET